MNVNKSFKVAMAMRGINAFDVAEKLQCSRARVYAVVNQKTVRQETMKALASAFGMKVSEFIALGE